MAFHLFLKEFYVDGAGKLVNIRPYPQPVVDEIAALAGLAHSVQVLARTSSGRALHEIAVAAGAEVGAHIAEHAGASAGGAYAVATEDGDVVFCGNGIIRVFPHGGGPHQILRELDLVGAV